MRFRDFRKVMLAKGYSMADILDCIRDFFRCDACPGHTLLALNQHVAICCDKIYSRLESVKKHYDVDDAFNKLIDKYFAKDFFNERSADEILELLCYDVWERICFLDSRCLDGYWRDLLKDC